jgi:protease-4
MSDKRGFITRFLGAFWNSITRVRVALSNILFLTVLGLIFFVFRGSAPDALPDKSALLLNPVGSIVEQKSYTDPISMLFSEPLPSEREVLLRDVIDAINFARDDDAITALVMDLKQLSGVGVSKTGEIAEALASFRESGKAVVAVGDYYSQSQYLLASEADNIILHPLGAVEMSGFGSYQWYFRDALDKLSVKMHVFRAGEHKSAAEPFMRNDMSPGEKEITLQWLVPMWNHYTETVESRRGLGAGDIDDYVANFPARLQAVDGDQAQAALEQGLVDQLAGRQRANEYLAEVVGATDKKGDYERVPFEHYLHHKRPVIDVLDADNTIAVVTARGMILDGSQPPGAIGGDSLAALLKKTAQDKNVKAIVLRVDSGGGSAFASEIIRQQILYAQQQSKPVVISMGSVAASGGYWISAPADEIWATPTTITGSIGVFGAFPTVEELMQKLGVHTDGVGTTELAGAGRLDRPLSPGFAQTLQASVDNIYVRFIELVAEGREMEPAAVDAIAQGRVWSAVDARRIGLVDELGGLQAAIEAAARLANLEDYAIDYREQPLSPQEMFLRQLLGQAQRWGWQGFSYPWQGAFKHWFQPLAASLEFAASMNDPAGVYAHCNRCLEP